MKLERHPAVVAQDLPRIYAFIARDDPAAADGFLDGVEQTLQQLRLHPQSGVRYPTGNRQLSTVRMLPVAGFENYLVFYRATDKAVRIRFMLSMGRNS